MAAETSTQARPESKAIASVPALPLRDRIILWSALATITALAWLYLVRMPMAPADLGGFGARVLSVLAPRFSDASLTFMMWTVMMVAMMIPNASPMVAMYARIAHTRATPALAVWTFMSAYIVVWTVFSAAATSAQITLQRASLISADLSASPLVASIILAIAGIYQLTPLKEACLGHCRSPLGFFMSEWRDGVGGAFRMGLKHGAFCVGCCWTLMALLFVFGVMNLLWVAALSVLVLLEKATVYGRAIARVAGVVMILGAVATAFRR
jgi:predicted metal-binding membrane protein